MNKEIEQLNADWKNYIKWCIYFPGILILLTIILLIPSLIFIENLVAAYYNRWSMNFILSMVGLILVFSLGLITAWIYYLYCIVKYSNKLLNIFQADFNFSISINTILIVLTVCAFVLTLLMTILQFYNQSFKFNLIIVPTLLLISHSIFLYIKMIDYWQSHIVPYNWKGMIK